MRLAPVAVAVAMLTIGLTGLAHSPTEERITNVPDVEDEDRYVNVQQIEDDVRLQAGWWADNGYAVNLSETQVDGVEESLEPEWVRVDDADGTATVNVASHGAVIAAVDVFEVPEDGGTFTPDCPQDAAYPLYPGEDEPAISYAARLLDETPQNTVTQPAQADDGHLHDEVEVELDLDENPEGYLLAVYPQVASDTLSNVTGDAFIQTEVTGDALSAGAVDTNRKADLPVELSQWIDPLSPNSYFQCPNEGVEPPSVIPLPDELPADQPTVEPPTEDDLLGASLPAPGATTQDGPIGHGLDLETTDGHTDETCSDAERKRTDEGYVMLANERGEEATVTEVAKFFVTDPASEATPFRLSPFANGLDAWVLDLGCELGDPGPGSANMVCLNHDHSVLPGQVTTGDLADDLGDRKYLLKFYGGEGLVDPRGTSSIQDVESIGGDGCTSAPGGTQYIVTVLEEGVTRGAYLDFTEQPPTGVYATDFCMSVSSDDSLDLQNCGAN